MTASPATTASAGPFALTADERAAWEKDGFFVREQVFEPDDLARLRAAAEAVAAAADEAIPTSDDQYAIGLLLK